MNDAAAALSVAAVAVTAALAVGPVPELDFVLQAAGLGSLVGLAVAIRARRRGNPLDAFTITARWTLFGALVALLLLSLDLVR